jgi:hypothetical protein
MYNTNGEFKRKSLSFVMQALAPVAYTTFTRIVLQVIEICTEANISLQRVLIQTNKGFQNVVLFASTFKTLQLFHY